MEMENKDYGEILKAFCDEHQRKLVEFITRQADELNPRAKAVLDRLFDSSQGDPEEAFLTLVNAYVDTAFGLGFTIGHSREIPALRPMVSAFLKQLKGDGLIPEWPGSGAEDSGPAGNA
jgi:hypothetical protein